VHYLLPVNDACYNQNIDSTTATNTESGWLVLSTNNYRYERRQDVFEGVVKRLGLRQQFLNMAKLLEYAEGEKAKDPRVSVQSNEFDLIHICVISRPSTSTALLSPSCSSSD